MFSLHLNTIIRQYNKNRLRERLIRIPLTNHPCWIIYKLYYFSQKWWCFFRKHFFCFYTLLLLWSKLNTLYVNFLNYFGTVSSLVAEILFLAWYTFQKLSYKLILTKNEYFLKLKYYEDTFVWNLRRIKCEWSLQDSPFKYFDIMRR